MRRFIVICVAALNFAGCSIDNAPVPEPPAALSAGAWTRDSVQRPAIGEAPAAVQAYRPVAWLRTGYRKGDSTVTLEVFRMPGEPTAFEARQKWLGASGSVSMNHGDLFLVVSSSSEAPQGLGQFLRLLEAEWLSKQAR